MAQEANSWDSGSIPGRDTSFDVPESSCLLSGLWLQPDRFRYNVEHRNVLRGAWSDRDTNDIFAHCSLIFYFIDFKFSNIVCPSELHPLMWFFLKKFLQEKEKYSKNHPKRLST